jgi:hypothetical protein
MNHRRSLLALLLIVALALPSLALAAEPGDVSGHWSGAILIPDAPLGVHIDFMLEEGTLKGDISVPQQKSKDLPLGDISVTDNFISFTIAGIQGAPKFTGAVSADGTQMTGDFTQGGQTFPFKLKRHEVTEKH